LTVLKCVFVVLVTFTASSVPDIQVAPESGWKLWRDSQSSAAGNCSECKAGEAMASSTVRIPPGSYVDVDNPSCGDPSFNSNRLPDQLKAALANQFRSQGSEGTYAVGISDKFINVARPAASQNLGTLGRLIRNSTGQLQVASCGRAIITIPREAAITRLVPTMKCPAGGWCALGGPATVDELDKSLVAATVVGKNWSHNTEASVILKIFYQRTSLH